MRVTLPAGPPGGERHTVGYGERPPRTKESRPHERIHPCLPIRTITVGIGAPPEQGRA